MTRYTVQCGYAAYYTNTVTVDADTVDEACAQAIADANDDPLWSSADVSSDTFVGALAQGDDVDLWSDAVRQLPVPAQFTERGEGPRVIVIVSGGVVQAVSIDDGYARVEVRDYDNKDDPEAKADGEGRRYALTDWSNVIPSPTGGG